jgi:hypothetical protein
MAGDEAPEAAGPPLRDLPELQAVFATEQGKKWAAILGDDSLEGILAGLETLKFVPCTVRHEDPVKGADLAPTNCPFHATNVACGHAFDYRYPDRAGKKLEKGYVAALVLGQALGEPDVEKDVEAIKKKLAGMSRLGSRIDNMAALAYARQSNPNRKVLPSIGEDATLLLVREEQKNMAEGVLSARDDVRALLLGLMQPPAPPSR